jgi:Ca-activated chloride channel family protein
MMAKQRFFIRLLLWSTLSLTAAFLWAGQQTGRNGLTADEQKPFTVGVEVNMVNVPITVRRPDGSFYKGLPQSAFHIYEDGVPQEIVFFTQEALPTRIAMLLDSSGSVRYEWGTIKYATKRFLENLHPDDEFSLISFNTDIRLKMDWGRKTDRVDPVLTSIYCKDYTKLWDAIWVTCNDVFKGTEEKKVVILMSDGMDTGSSVDFKEALMAAVRSEAALYIVSKTEAVRQSLKSRNKDYGYYGRIPSDDFFNADLLLRKLAHETGGRVLYPNSFGQLNDVYAQVYEELRSQYTIGYISTNKRKDGSYRSINVRVNASDATGYARPGYYAPSE